MCSSGKGHGASFTKVFAILYSQSLQKYSYSCGRNNIYEQLCQYHFNIPPVAFMY